MNSIRVGDQLYLCTNNDAIVESVLVAKLTPKCIWLKEPNFHRPIRYGRDYVLDNYSVTRAQALTSRLNQLKKEVEQCEADVKRAELTVTAFEEAFRCLLEKEEGITW